MFAQRHFHEYGTTREQLGADRAERPRATPALNPKAIYRDPMSMDDYLNVAHDLDAVLPLRLRRAVRRRDRGHRVAARHGAKDLRKPPLRVEAVGTAHRTAVRRGTSSTTSRRWRTATRARSCGTRTDLQAGRRADGASSTTASRFITMSWLEALGLLRRGRERPVHRGRRRASPATASCRSTPTAASSRPAGCTATASCTKARRSCGARPATARSPTPPEVGVIARRRRQHLRLPAPRARVVGRAGRRRTDHSGQKPDSRRNMPLMRRLSPLSWLLIVVGIVFLVVGVIYLTITAPNLPGFIPGHVGHVKHARHYTQAGHRGSRGRRRGVHRRLLQRLPPLIRVDRGQPGHGPRA